MATVPWLASQFLAAWKLIQGGELLELRICIGNSRRARDYVLSNRHGKRKSLPQMAQA